MAAPVKETMTTETMSHPQRPGYEFRASFPGGEPYWRPRLSYLVAMLEAFWGIRRIGKLPSGEIIIAHIDPGKGLRDWWVVTENGGEINLTKINTPDDASVPYHQVSGLVPIGRLAWFCVQVLWDEEIVDYGKNPAVDDLSLADLSRTGVA